MMPQHKVGRESMIGCYSRRIRFSGAAFLFTVLFLGVINPVSAQSYLFILKWGSNGSGDGQFNYSYCIAADGSGNVYISELYGYRVQKFTTSGSFILKWGTQGSGDGQFDRSLGVAIDGSGNVYVADDNNHRVQKFDSSGSFMLKWGSFGSGDGQFYGPSNVAVDGSGNVYVSDTSNNRIQKFNSSGGFVTKWGSSGTGDGQFSFPAGVAVDSSGNVYVADYFNHRVQKFTGSGSFITKWGGLGSGDGQFRYPAGVAVDGSGNVYVADTSNHRVQKFGQGYTLTITTTTGGTTNPSPGSHTYIVGATVSVTATPNVGYYFDHWELPPGANIGSFNPISLTMTKDYSLHAVFASAPPSVPEFPSANLSLFASTLAFMVVFYFTLKKKKKIHSKQL